MEKFQNILRVPNSDLPEGICSTAHQINLPTFLEQKFLNRNLQKFKDICLSSASEYSSWESKNGAVQMFFLTPTTNMFLAMLREYIFYNVEWDEIRKMSELFWTKLYCKMSENFS